VPSARTPKNVGGTQVASVGTQGQAQTEPQPAAQPLATTEQQQPPAQQPTILMPKRVNVVGRSCPVVRVHFAFDSIKLDDNARKLLDESAKCLGEDRALRLRIEGGADERGPADYNLALGERRANAARKYLESQGISTDRVVIVSFGEARPLCKGSNEDCWRMNRRATVRPGASDTASIPRERD
jgi:peptidoglycan-associated lipoprotein